MNECCLSKETRSYYNNLSYHIAKNVIEKKMEKFKSAEVLDFLNEIITDLDDVFPSDENGWNYCFERKLIELGFFFEEDKKRIDEIRKIYEKKQTKFDKS